MIIYLDESGDLGWSFHAPYRAGGSSRYLTISSLVVSPDFREKPKRLIKRMYSKYNWPTSDEKKWSSMTPEERVYFASKAHELFLAHPNDIKYYSITVFKPRVQQHIRLDSNKLYNYMIGLSLIDEMALHNAVTFVPDPRSIKVKSGNSLHDYLQTKLWFDKSAQTLLSTIPADSAKTLNIQFADMISGVVQSHFEDANSAPFNALSASVVLKKLYF